MSDMDINLKALKKVTVGIRMVYTYKLLLMVPKWLRYADKHVYSMPIFIRIRNKMEAKQIIKPDFMAYI